jgi:hypothetical protein
MSDRIDEIKTKWNFARRHDRRKKALDSFEGATEEDDDT